ncbi:MAG: hypothetical protein A2001_17005 [Treponema sp. GWC1_61_84]|nr:MAG: hypothetical protein A2001_17005 [Treponema sp. GWC1_61_84]
MTRVPDRGFSWTERGRCSERRAVDRIRRRRRAVCRMARTIERKGDDGRGTAWKLAVPPEPDGGEA